MFCLTSTSHHRLGGFFYAAMSASIVSAALKANDRNTWYKSPGECVLFRNGISIAV